MAQYQISEKTKSRLIQSAGELFAATGIDGVTTREIARKAGTVQNAIAYHFGGIGGLIEAVWRYVLDTWDPGQFGRYLEENRGLLKDAAGQRQLVRGAVALLFRIMMQQDQPLWINKFLVRAAMSGEGREEIARMISGSVVPALIGLYRRLVPAADPDAARCWSLRILAAPMVFTAELTVFSRLYEAPGLNLKLYQSLQESTTREALFAVGLIPVEQESV